MASAIFFPLDLISPGQLISEYSEWIYFALIMVFFMAVAGIALRRHFQHPYVKPLIVAIGLLMAVMVFQKRQYLSLILESWGTIGSLLLFGIAAVIPFGLAKGLGLPAGRAGWLSYVLLYLLAWAHLPEFFQGLANRGLGIINLVLLVLFVVAIWRGFRIRLAKPKWMAGAKLTSPDAWEQRDREDTEELNHELKVDQAEARALKKEALPMTMKELKSCEDVEEVLKAIQKTISSAKGPLSHSEKEKIVALLRKTAGIRQFIQAIASRLKSIFQRINVLGEKQVGEMRDRYENAKGKKEKLIKEELTHENEKLVLRQTVGKLASRVTVSLKAFDDCLNRAVGIFRSGSDPMESLPVIDQARRAVKNIKTLTMAMSDVEKRMVWILKHERKLMERDQKK